MSLGELRTLLSWLGIAVSGLTILVAAIFYLRFMNSSAEFIARCCNAGTAPRWQMLRWAVFLDRLKISIWWRTKKWPHSPPIARLIVEFMILNGIELDDPALNAAARSDALVKLAELLDRYAQGEAVHHQVPNCSKLADSQDLVKAYFHHLKALEKTAEPVFIGTVQIGTGYFAPLFLIQGLLAQLDEDWQPVLDGYNRLVAQQDLLPRNMQEVQLFQFNCWLLWGPSIPMCTCHRWDASSAGADLVQFGYGDECNSILVQVDPAKGMKSLGDVLANNNETIDAIAHAPYALKADDIKLKLRSIEQLQKSADAQAGAVAQERIWGTLLDSGDIRQGKGSGTCYYSAYVWMMFLLCDLQGRPLYSGKDSSWRNLLPLFEHGNIADVSTLAFIKNSLVSKAASAIGNILTQHPNIVLRYACGIDDSQCEKKIRMPPPAGSSLREMLSARVAADSALLAFRDSKRLIIPGSASNTQEHVYIDYCSCELPARVSAYTKAIKLENGKHQQQPRQAAPALESATT